MADTTRHTVGAFLLLLGCGVAEEVYVQNHSFSPKPAHCSDVCKKVTYQGYPCECHTVLTSDGFELQTVRLPQRHAPLVWIQHGFEGSCIDFISQPTVSHNLAYMLHDAGYDVWIGNARGNAFAFNNTNMDYNTTAFWNAVDIDTMASLDTPSMIDYALSTTRRQKLSWIGHSQGTTQMIAALASRYTLKDGREISEALDGVVLLAPVAYIYHCHSLLLKILASIHANDFYKVLDDKDFLGPKVTKIFHRLTNVCGHIPLGKRLCPNLMWPILGGGNWSNTAQGTYDNATIYDPADSSVHNLAHWTQHMRVDRFGKYDYGKQGNMQKYDSPTPPDYNLSDVRGVNMALFSGTKDDLSDPEDVARLLKELPNETVAFHKTLPTYGHMDFSWGKDARVLVYEPILQYLKQQISFEEIAV